MDDQVPLYERVRREILAEIETGRLAAGSFLPPEAERNIFAAVKK